MSNEELANAVREWRGRVPAVKAAPVLGIPKRTFDNIEQGRGFPYPQLLMAALLVVKPPKEFAMKEPKA
jgi:hypothetical protein